MSNQPDVGFVGLGSMGAAMAVQLLRSGLKVVGYDVNEVATREFHAAGGQVATSARAVVEQASSCEVLVIMVATTDQASAVLFDGQSSSVSVLRHDAVVLLCITAAPEYAVTTRAALDAAGRKDVVLLDCPVSGGANRAADGTLSILVSGTEKIPSNGMQVLKTLGSSLHHVPGPPGSAFALKMVHQILVGVHIVAANEAMALAATGGLDFRTVLAAVMASDAASWLFGERVPHMQDLDQPPYSSLAVILKDMVLVTEMAWGKQCGLPLSSIAQQVFRFAKAAGWGMHDDCATIRMYLLGRESLLPQNRKEQGSYSPPWTPGAGRITVRSVIDLLCGVHLAAALEAFSLLEVLGLDAGAFFSFVLGAAGASSMFLKLRTPGEQGSGSSLRAHVNIDEVIENLVSAIGLANAADCITPLGVTALNQLIINRGQV